MTPTLSETREQCKDAILRSINVTLNMLIKASIPPTSYIQRHGLDPDALRVASTQPGLLDTSLHSISAVCKQAKEQPQLWRQQMYGTRATTGTASRPRFPTASINAPLITPRKQASTVNNETKQVASHPITSVLSPTLKPHVFQDDIHMAIAEGTKPSTTGNESVRGVCSSDSTALRDSSMPVLVANEPPRLMENVHDDPKSHLPVLRPYEPPQQSEDIQIIESSPDATPGYRSPLNLCLTSKTYSNASELPNQHHATYEHIKPTAVLPYAAGYLNDYVSSSNAPNSDDVRTVSGYEMYHQRASTVPVLKLQEVQQPTGSPPPTVLFHGPPTDVCESIQVTEHNEMIRFIQQYVPDVQAVEVPTCTSTNSHYNNRAKDDTILGMTTSTFATDCIKDREQELKILDARTKSSNFMQIQSTRVLNVQTKAYRTGDKSWPITAPSLPPGFSQHLPDLKSDHAIRVAYHDVCNLETTSRTGFKISSDGLSALDALTALLPDSAMARRLHQHVLTAMQDNIKLFAYTGTALYQLRRDVALAHSNFADKDRLLLRHSMYHENEHLFEPTLLKNVVSAEVERTQRHNIHGRDW